MIGRRKNFPPKLLLLRKDRALPLGAPVKWRKTGPCSKEHLSIWQQAFSRSPSAKREKQSQLRSPDLMQKNKAAGTHTWGREPASLLAPVKPLLELELFSLNTLFFQLTQPGARVQSLESGVPGVGWTPASTDISSTGCLCMGLKLHSPKCHPGRDPCSQEPWFEKGTQSGTWET